MADEDDRESPLPSPDAPPAEQIIPDDVNDDDASSQPACVFISYRANPDAPLATALKRLIESSIEPQPQVFVAGDGGLRPSNVGFKQQLQTEAQRAHAFIGIITNASKDREWIFFEAGAAWGRNQMYAPMLVGATPEDMPRTIGDYQAVRAQRKEDVLLLVRTIAELANSQLRDRFGQRFQLFGKAVESYLKGDEVEVEADGNVILRRAKRVAADGDVAAASELFDQLESRLTDPEQLCNVQVARIMALAPPQDHLSQMLSMSPEAQSTSTYHYYVAQQYDQPLLKSQYLRRSVQIGHTNYAVSAQIQLARLDYEGGAHETAIDSLAQVIELGDSADYREFAAKTLTDIVSDLEPLEGLMILLAGLSGSNARGYKNIVALAAKNGWKLLQLFCASRAVALQESGASYNSLGIARVGVDLPALAFKAYSKAADLGVSVALCNKSSILANSGNNGAALEILSSYQGEFDAADPGMPYELRARMERAVKQERDKEAELLERGRRQLQALWTIAAQALRTRATEIAQPNGRLGGILNPINIQEGKCPPIGLLAQYAAARLEAS